MPSGGDGYYFLSAYLMGDNGENSYFDIDINGHEECTIRLHNTNGFPQSACSATVYLTEGIIN